MVLSISSGIILFFRLEGVNNIMRIRTAEISDAYIIGHIQFFSWKTMFPDSGVDASAYLAEFNSEERAEAWQENRADPVSAIVAHFMVASD